MLLAFFPYANFLIFPFFLSSSYPTPAIPVVVANKPNPVGLLHTVVTLSVAISLDIPPVQPDMVHWYFYPMEKVCSSSNGSDTVDECSSEVIGQEILEGDFTTNKRNLTLPLSNYASEGVYTVRVENLAGNASTQICLDVQGEK